MDAIQEEDFEMDSGGNHNRLRRNFSRQTSDADDMVQMKQNVQRALKDARKKINDLRNEVDRKDEIIRQERPIHEAADRSTTSDAYETSRYSPSRFKTSQYSGHHQSPQKTNEDQLQEELTVLDGLNDRLMEKLTRTESRLESVQLHKDEMSLETEAKIAARGAALVDKIYKAQKERDAAVLSRLRLANGERDEVLSRMKRLEQEQQGFDSGVDSVYDDEDQDLSMKHLFHGIVNAETGASIDRQGDLMVAQFRKHGKSKHVMAAEQIQALIDERDEALYKVKALEKEVDSLQREKELMRNQYKFAEKARIKSGQAQLMAAQNDRVESCQRIKELEEELQNVRVYYSLHRSLSQEQTLKDQFNETMDRFESKLHERDNELQLAQNSTDELVARLQAMAREKDLISAQLTEAINSQTKEKERADKLERLVTVLRKRITSSGNQTL